MRGWGPAGRWAARLAAVGLLVLACGLAAAQQKSAPAKPDPPILIGPSRVTLVGGKTLEAIAVFREPGRVRVVLEDDTEIAFDPAKVVSVIALADLPDTPPPAVKPASSAPSAPSASKGSASAAKKGDKGAGGKAAATSVKVHAEPAGNGKTGSTRQGAADAKSGDPEADPAGATGAGGGSTGDAAAAKAKEEREREVEELAGMLQAAIANAALEGHGTGGPADAADDVDAMEGKAGKDATVSSGDGAGTPAAGDDEKKVYKPRPEDFDATRPVNKAGYRFLGPKGKVPETPPQIDFPKPAEPSTSLGFGGDTWRPSSGFSSNAAWGTQLAPATSFSNRLSGLDPPITSFGPRWWGPTQTAWPTSIFPAYWQPKDGFAQTQERKNPPPPAPTSGTSDQDK